MLGKCWTGAYCRYFRSAVLPLDPVLERSLTVEHITRCAAGPFSRTGGSGTAPRPAPVLQGGRSSAAICGNTGVDREHLTPENTLDCRVFWGRFMGGAYDFIAPPGFAEILLTFWNLHEIVIVCGIGISNACFLCICEINRRYFRELFNNIR